VYFEGGQSLEGGQSFVTLYTHSIECSVFSLHMHIHHSISDFQHALYVH